MKSDITNFDFYFNAVIFYFSKQSLQPRRFIKITLLTIIFISIFLACETQEIKEKEIPFLSLKRQSFVSEFGEGVYFGGITDIDKIGENYYFLDADNNKIICAGSDLGYKFQFIEEGGAEFEAQGLQTMGGFLDTLYISDVSKGRVMVFDKLGQFVESYRSGLWGIGDFFVDKADIFVFNDDNNARDKPIMQFDKYQKTFISFGEAADEDFKNPDRHILPLNDQKFLSIYAENRPVIEFYDRDGTLIAKQDLSYLNIFQQVLTTYEEGKKNPNVDLVIIPDAHYTDGHLYLLVSRTEKREGAKDEWFSYQIIDCIVDESNNLVRPKKVLELDRECWYESFFVDAQKGFILAGNHTYTYIEKYPLP